MSYSSQDAEIINIPNHVVQYKLELLDANYGTAIDSLTGDATNVTFNIDAGSDIRRTGTLTMLVRNPDWLTENFEIGWINKLVRFSIGLQYDAETEPPYVDIAKTDSAMLAGKHTDFKWYVLGTMLLTSDSLNYDDKTKELVVSLVDVMAFGTAERGSQIGTMVRYEHNANIKKALSATLARFFPFKDHETTRYDPETGEYTYDTIDEFPDVLPYDLTFGAGAYPYELIAKIVGLFPWYEQFYDANGIYHAHQIPMHQEDPCQLYAADINDLIIIEKRSFNFSKIKNSTEIYGKAIKANYTASTVELSGDTYTLGFITPLSLFEPNKKIGFKATATSPASPKIHVALDGTVEGEPDTLPLLNSNGEELEAGALREGYSYVVRCVATTEQDGDDTVIVKKLYLMGQTQIHVLVREMNVMPTADEIEADKLRNDCMDIRYVVNPDSPYACDRWVQAGNVPVRLSIERGEIRQVLYDGDYASITTTELGYQRGEYENYLKCRMNTDVELTTILIPFIDVNQKIEYTSPITKETHQYIVKSVNMDVSRFTMTMQLARFYNYYPYI